MRNCTCLLHFEVKCQKMFLSKLVKTDVTAVKLFPNHIVTGIGASLFVYDRTTNRLIQENKVFDGHKIHGIVPNDSNTLLLVYGGNNCKIVTFNLQQLRSVRTDSWILTAKWLSNGTVALVHMTNKLSIFDENLVELKEIFCKEKSILYSACICGDESEVIVLSGTVFSEILVWKPLQNQVLTRLKGHNGVIFAISYAKGLICSASDDRSAILWSIGEDLTLPVPEIKCRVFGHQSRVFCCKISDNFFVTGGEDSVVNLWGFDGVLIRKIQVHQQSPVWCLDCDSNLIVSGGGDGGVSTFPVTTKLSEYQLTIPGEVPKRIGILQNYLVAITENGTLFCYFNTEKEWKKIEEYQDLKSYVVMEISKCRNLVSLSGYNGQIYIYKLSNDRLELAVSQIGQNSRIFSFHWLSCGSFFTCGNEGKLSLWLLRENSANFVTNFILPPSKERWTTSACQTPNGLYIIGDRRGNLYVYKLGNSQPIQTLKKAHNYLGVTQVSVYKDKIMSLGRNAVLNTFSLNSNKLTRVSSDKLPFTWLSSLLQDIIVAFSGNNFVVWNYEKRRICLKINCGGGHRSWDFFKNQNQILFVYLKDKTINVVEGAWTELSSTDLVNGFHNFEINSIKLIETGGKILVLSGGEDTSLRISSINENNFVTLNNFKAHLSSVRTICVCKTCEDCLIFSGGGRAQIICWKLKIEEGNVDLMEQHSYYEEINNEESEVRIMDLVAVAIENKIQLFAASSDGNIKVFDVLCPNGKYELNFFTKLFYKLRCIMKLSIVKVANCNFLVSMATDGNLVFWNISNISFDSTKIQPLKSINCHQSGINSFSFKILNDHVIFVTGGDDNAIAVNYLKIEKVNENIEILEETKFYDFGTHCAQITGIYVCDNYFLTTSIDQKLAIFNWSIISREFVCNFLCKYNSAIADIQGMECFPEKSVLNVLLYGKGIEYLQVKI